MDDMQTDLVAITNLQHEYAYITKAGAMHSGYKSVNGMLGTTIFDLKAPVVEIASFVHGLNLQVVKNKKPLYLFDIGIYGGGLSCCITSKSPYFTSAENIFSGIITRTTMLPQQSFTPFLLDLYQNALILNRADKFGGIAYELVEKYAEHNLTVKESKVLFLLAHGKPAAKIAKLSNRSVKTIEGHIEKIKNKLGVSRKEQLVEYMIHTNLIHKIPQDLCSQKMFRKSC